MHRFVRRGQLMLMLAVVLTAFAVSACGGSSSVSSAVKSKLVSVLTQQGGLTKTQATKMTACLVPVLKSHGITTIGDAKAFNSSPAWLTSASAKCAKKVL
jgi:ABC-type enterobactin transport system permease subunit